MLGIFQPVTLVFLGVNDMVVFSWSTHHKLLICRSECAPQQKFFQLTDGDHDENGIFDVWTFKKKAWVVSNSMDKCAGQRRNLSSNRCEHVSKSLKPALSWISQQMIYIQEHALCSVKKILSRKKIIPIYSTLIQGKLLFPITRICNLLCDFVDSERVPTNLAPHLPPTHRTLRGPPTQTQPHLGIAVDHRTVSNHIWPPKKEQRFSVWVSRVPGGL